MSGYRGDQCGEEISVEWKLLGSKGIQPLIGSEVKVGATWELFHSWIHVATM